MLRKVFITGLIMFVSPGSMLQLVVALVFSIGFLTASAWLEPYGPFNSRIHVASPPLNSTSQMAASRAANIFKVGTEVTILLTLTMSILLRFDLSEEDISEDFVGVLLFCSSTIIPGATLALGVLTDGLGVAQEIKVLEMEMQEDDDTST
jgi:hypothetical protein